MDGFLFLSLISIGFTALIIVIRVVASTSKARGILRQAERAEVKGDLDGAIGHYKRLILAVAANEKEVPEYLLRIQSIYKKKGLQVDSGAALAAHGTIVDIWHSKMPDSEKKQLHKTAVQGLMSVLDALA